MGYGRERKQICGRHSKQIFIKSNPMTRLSLVRLNFDLWRPNVNEVEQSQFSFFTSYINYAILYISYNSTNTSLVGIGFHIADSSRQLSSIFM